MKIIKLLEIADRPEVFIQVPEEQFNKFIYHFKYWRDNPNEIEISLFNYLEDNGVQCEFLCADLVISANCEYNDLDNIYKGGSNYEINRK
jgi:hypothetical protein